MIASFLGTNAFAVAGDRTAEFTPGVRVLADCGADGARYGTVAAALYAADADRTTVTLTLDADGLTASLAAVLHGNDIPASLANHGHAGPADGGLLGTATPTANAHPIASALGRLTAWIDAATTSVAGIVKLATTAMCQAGTDTATAVTPAGLASSAKGLITSNTTIYVATTGNDVSGDGSLSSPFASIAQALASIKNKLIASGMTVTIQVVNGTYTISSSITIDHPDADKIQIFGNTTAETTVAIGFIDTGAKSITLTGGVDYTGSIQIGDTVGLTGSSTSGLNGAYTVSDVAYSGGNTVITCSAETIASATVGGGSIIIKPCNRCVISTSTTFIILARSLKQIRGFRVDNASGTSNRAISSTQGQTGVVNIYNCIFDGVARAVQASCTVSNVIFKNCTDSGMFAATSNVMSLSALCIFDGCFTAMTASSNGYIYAISSRIVARDNTNLTSPAVNMFGNGIGYVQY